MKRRSFLQGLLGGAVAAPSMAKGAAAHLSELQVSNYGLQPHGNPISGWPTGCVETASSVQDQLTDFLLNKTWRDYLPHAYVSGFDVDIASLHSVSLSAKMNMQRKRNAVRIYEDTRMALERDLRQLLGASKND